MITTKMTETEELRELQAEETQLQNRIGEVKARIAAIQRSADIAALAEIRSQIAEHTTFIEQNLPIFREQVQGYDNGRNHLIAARQAVAESKHYAPAVAELLPEDREVRKWRQNHARLEEQLREMQTTFDSHQDPEVLRLQLVERQQTIAALGHSELHLTAKLSDGRVREVDPRNTLNAKSWIR